MVPPGPGDPGKMAPTMSKKLIVGIIGSGGIAQSCHMRGYASVPELCEMKWACDVNPEVAKEAAGKFDVPHTTTDFMEVINDPAVDAVSVATPNAFHAVPTIEALKAGKHVLCEKPLAMNAEEAKLMCRAAKDAGKILQVGFQLRFAAPGVFMKDYIEKGHMGDIYYARAQALRRRGVPGWGVFIDKEKQGGGPLVDIGVHILDLTLHFMGHPKPVSASGKIWDTLGKNPALFNFWGDYDRSKYTVEDFAVGFIRFDNGAVVTLESSFMGNLENDPFQTQAIIKILIKKRRECLIIADRQFLQRDANFRGAPYDPADHVMRFPEWHPLGYQVIRQVRCHHAGIQPAAHPVQARTATRLQVAVLPARQHDRQPGPGPPNEDRAVVADRIERLADMAGFADLAGSVASDWGRRRCLLTGCGRRGVRRADRKIRGRSTSCR